VISRRSFVAQIGAVGILAASGVAAQPRSRPQLGVVHPASVEDSAVYRILVPKLAELGYVDGKTIKLTLRSGGGKPDALAPLVDDLVREKVDVLLVVGPAAVGAAVAATRSVPIIAIDLESDPVGRGWMQSLSRPGGNLTGFFLDLTGTGAKWLQLLHEVVPRARQVSLVWDAAAGQPQLAATRAAADSIGIRASTITIENWEEFDNALGAAVRNRTDALVVLSSPTAYQFSSRLAQFVLRNRLPAISPFRPFATAGGLMSYGPDLDVYFGRVASMVDKVLRGAKPADLAVEQPVKYELVINQRTGAALGLTLPRSLLLRADEVIR